MIIRRCDATDCTLYDIAISENIAFPKSAIHIFKTFKPINGMIYGPNFNCADCSWPKLQENANPPLWHYRLHLE